VKVITLAKTKELLGITDTASDTQISAKIPYIDSKVKQITNNRYNMLIVGNTTLDSPYVTVSSIYTYNRGITYYYRHNTRRNFVSGINNYCYFDDLGEFLETGQLIEGTGIPAEAYLDEIYYNGDLVSDGTNNFDIPTVKLSANATSTNEGVRLYLGIPIAYQDTIAQGIQYLINKTSTTLPGQTVTRVGTVAYSDADSKINGKYGMPAWFVKPFPKYVSGH
jgi:hypothetical protein